jgi:hypothetical protein
MTALILQFFAPILPWIIAALAALAGLWGYGRAKQREGRKDAEAVAAAKAARDTIHAYEVRNEVEADVAGRADARKRLHTDWRE